MPTRLANKLLLLGWDAADWRVMTPLLEAGEMPALESVINRGVMGNLATLTPIISPMIWTSIATGRRADAHGILGFLEPDPVTGGIRPVSSTQRRVKALWNILTQSGIDANVVNWLASHPAEPINGVAISNLFPTAAGRSLETWRMKPGMVHPATLEDEFAALRIHPAELEAGHLLPLVPYAAEIDQEKDTRLAVLARFLAECFTTHAAATWIMEHRPWEFLGVYFDLIDHLGHMFMPFHPPRMEGVSEQDFRLYGDVVRGAYKLMDMLLERSLELAGPDTTVVIVSDHGFHSDRSRPRGRTRFRDEGPLVWHRSQGMICMAGPGIVADELIHGAHVVDVTPTILSLLGLPIGADMEGRVIHAAFEQPCQVEMIPTWEERPGDCGMHPDDFEEDPWDAREALQQLVDLGYIDEPSADEQRRIDYVERAQKFNLARVYIEGRQFELALPLLEELVHKHPTEDTYAVFLAQCHFRLARFAECRQVLQQLLDQETDKPTAQLMMANLCVAEQRWQDALDHLELCELRADGPPQLDCHVGRILLQLGRLEDARHAFQVALEKDSDCVRAHYGLAITNLKERRWTDAADAALTAVNLDYHHSRAHFALGQALIHLGSWDRAIQAMEASVTIDPDFLPGHRRLARLYSQRLDSQKADHHRRRAADLAAAAPPG